MPTVDLGTENKIITIEDVNEVTDTDHASYGEALATFGLSVLASSLVSGVIGVAFSIALGAKTIQDIEDLVDMAKLSDQANKALMSFRKSNYKGCIVCVFQKEKWVSSNGNINSGEDVYPIEIYYIKEGLK